MAEQSSENVVPISAKPTSAIVFINPDIAARWLKQNKRNRSQNPGLRGASDFAGQVARKTDCPPAVVAYTFFEMSKLDTFAAAQFWMAASEKVGLREGDPVIALTNRFAEARRNREVLSKRIYLSLIYRAWNARRQGKTMRFIRVNSPSGGLVPIPEPK